MKEKAAREKLALRTRWVKILLLTALPLILYLVICERLSWRPQILSISGAEARSVAFSADGKHLVTLSDNNLLRLWNVPQNKVRARLALPNRLSGAAYSSPRFSPRGDRVVASESEEQKQRLYHRAVIIDIGRGKIVRKIILATNNFPTGYWGAVHLAFWPGNHVLTAVVV